MKTKCKRQTDKRTDWQTDRQTDIFQIRATDDTVPVCVNVYRAYYTHGLRTIWIILSVARWETMLARLLYFKSSAGHSVRQSVCRLLGMQFSDLIECKQAFRFLLCLFGCFPYASAAAFFILLSSVGFIFLDFVVLRLCSKCPFLVLQQYKLLFPLKSPSQRKDIPMFLFDCLFVS